jgi:lipoic acid synthetase
VRRCRSGPQLGLRYVVTPSVDRDDLADGGAWIFAETIRRVRVAAPDCRVEVLIPDYQGIESSLRPVLDAGPDVLNHNTETVPRCIAGASGRRYPATLELLDRARTIAPEIPTKTGLILGLGEEWDEIVETLADLRKVWRRDSHHRPVPCAQTESHLKMVRTTIPTSLPS